MRQAHPIPHAKSGEAGRTCTLDVFAGASFYVGSEKWMSLQRPAILKERLEAAVKKFTGACHG